MSLDKYRVKPPRRAGFLEVENEEHEAEHDNLVEEDDMHDEDEPPETYKAKYTCSNCGVENEDDVSWGQRIEETTFECPHCGCET